MKRICSICKQPQDLEAGFAWKSKARGRRHSHCKQCQKEISHEHYEENSAEYIERAKARYRANRTSNLKRLRAMLAAQRCELCPNTADLEFVPRRGEALRDTIPRLLGQSWDVVSAEVLKCQVLCALCRRRAKAS